MVIAGLIVLQAYLVAGKPERLPAMGSFDDWEWIRGALVWLGEDDPAVTRAGVFKKDPVREELLTVMRLWDEVFKGRKVRVSDLMSIDGDDQDPEGKGRQLKEALIEAVDSRVWNSKAVGKWLSRRKGRVVEGRFFELFDEDRMGCRWVLMSSQKELFPE
jgi:hypothetical protein